MKTKSNFFLKLIYLMVPGLYSLSNGRFPSFIFGSFIFFTTILFNIPNEMIGDKAVLFQRFFLIGWWAILSLYPAFKLGLTKKIPVVSPFHILAIFFIFLGFYKASAKWPISIGEVPDASMYPVLQVGEKVAIWENADQYQRGDIAIFINPEMSKILFRKIYALAGDQVLVQNGSLFINGRKIKEVHDLNINDIDALIVPDYKVMWMAEARQDSSKEYIWGLADTFEMSGKALWVQKSASNERNGLKLTLSKKSWGQ